MGSVEAKFFFCVIVVDVEADQGGGGGACRISCTKIHYGFSVRHAMY